MSDRPLISQSALDSVLLGGFAVLTLGWWALVVWGLVRLAF